MREDNEINKRESITQYSKANVIDLEHGSVYESSFAFPFDLQFIQDHSEESAATPNMLFQVNSLDSWNRNRIEGYGSLQLPMDEGTHEFRIQTWKPRGTFYNELYSFFLGGSVRVFDMNEITKTANQDEKGEEVPINRFNIETEDSGEILVRVNCASHNHERKKKNRAAFDLAKEQQLEHLKAINQARIKNIKKLRKEFEDNLSDEEILSKTHQDSKSYKDYSYSQYSRSNYSHRDYD